MHRWSHTDGVCCLGLLDEHALAGALSNGVHVDAAARCLMDELRSGWCSCLVVGEWRMVLNDGALLVYVVMYTLVARLWLLRMLTHNNVLAMGQYNMLRLLLDLDMLYLLLVGHYVVLHNDLRLLLLRLLLLGLHNARHVADYLLLQLLLIAGIDNHLVLWWLLLLRLWLIVHDYLLCLHLGLLRRGLQLVGVLRLAQVLVSVCNVLLVQLIVGVRVIDLGEYKCLFIYIFLMDL